MNKSYVILTILILSLSMAPVLEVFANPDTTELSPKVLGIKIKVDLTSQLKQLGYDTETMTAAPITLIRELVESYPPVTPTDFEDNTAQTSINKNEYSHSISIEKSSNADSINDLTITEDKPVYTLTTETKACLIVAIEDYPGEEHDLNPSIHNAYVDLVNYATNYGGYQQITSLENSQGTKQMITYWLTWLCSTYDNVDLYLLGHGAEIMVFPFAYYWYGFMSYDAVYVNGQVNPSAIFYTFDLVSDWPPPMTKDRSPLRMTIVGSCFGWEFCDEALSPGGFTQHTRAFVGGDGQVWTDYIELFIEQWCILWYQNNWDSSSARYNADNYAWQYSSQQGVRYSYADTGTQVWC